MIVTVQLLLWVFKKKEISTKYINVIKEMYNVVTSSSATGSVEIFLLHL